MGKSFATPVRAPGRFGFQAVGGVVAGDGHSQWEPIDDLPMAMQYAYGTMRAADGTYYWPIRGAFTDTARRMHLSEAAAGADFTWAEEGENAYIGPVEHGVRDGWSGTWRPDGSLLYATDGLRFRWAEGDFLSIEGELVGDALQFAMPDALEPMVYTSRLFRGTGTIKGVPVSGLFFHDSMHMPPGMNFITSAFINDLQAAWVAFATEYEDGTIHAGHLVWGTDGFDIMILQRTDGPPLVARDLEVEVVLKDDFPIEVRYTGRGETWVWEAHPAGYRDPIRTDLPEGHRRIQGWAHLEGETRRPVMTEGLMETYNGRLDDVLRS